MVALLYFACIVEQLEFIREFVSSIEKLVSELVGSKVIEIKFAK